MAKQPVQIGPRRRGESKSFPYRSGRIYAVGSEWYFATREGVDQGPYPSKRKVEAALAAFLALCLTKDGNARGAVAVPRQTEKSRQSKTTEFDAMLGELLEYFQIRENHGLHTAILWASVRIRLLAKTRTEDPVEHIARRIEALEDVIEKDEELS